MSFGRRFVAAVGLCATIGAYSPTAVADEGATALALFRAGREAMARGDFDVACKRFRESAGLERAPGTLLNLGECNARLGKLASAWSAYSEAGDRLPAGDPRRDYAREKAAELAPRLARIQLRSGGADEDCTLILDGTRLPSSAAEQPLPVDAGRRALSLECEGHERVSREVVAVDGRVVEAALARGAKLHVEAPGAPTPQVARGAGSPLVPVGWVLGGIGLASLGVGVATGVMTIDRKGTVDALCSDDPTPRCPPAGIDAASEGRSFATVSTATFVGGTALLAAGATLLLVGSGDASDRPEAGDAALLLRGGLSSEVVFRARF